MRRARAKAGPRAGARLRPTFAPWSGSRLRRAAAQILAAGLRAAEPSALVARQLRIDGGRLRVAGRSYPIGPGGVVLLAVGKAAAAMARAAEERLGRHLAKGLVVTNAPPSTGLRSAVLVAGHPVPDERGIEAARAAESLLRGSDSRDLMLVLLSGGASALLPAPSPGLRLEDKARTTSLLLRAGASIHELNAVRKHLSRLKGGGLARAAAPARVITLLLSDVVGDDLSTIASGPTVPDPTTFDDAIAVLVRRGILDEAPPAVRRHLEAGRRGDVPETPKPGDPTFRRTVAEIVGSNRLSIAAAAREARLLGLRPAVLTTRLEGEAREVARVLVAMLRETVESGRPLPPPVCLLAGGETTVTVTGDGEGGRNQELAVAAAMALDGFPVPAVVASLATDGLDGKSDGAGGVVDERTVRQARALGLEEAAGFLARNDSRNFLGPLGGLIRTGPTGTNVVDLTVLLTGARARL